MLYDDLSTSVTHACILIFITLFLLLESSDDPFEGPFLSHWNLWLTQFYALLVKRLHYTKGRFDVLMLQNLLPLLMIACGLFSARHLQILPYQSPLELSPNLFFAVSHYNYLFAGGHYTNETASMIDSLFQPCGIGSPSICPETSNRTACYQDPAMTSSECPETDYPQQQYTCSCPTCDADSTVGRNKSFFARSAPPCYNGTVTGSRVQNLTLPYDPLNPDVGYLTLHEYLLRSTDSFVEQRYGGVSFGHFKQDVDAEVDELNSDPESLPFLATHSAAKVWVSLKGYHSMPAYLNTMNNAILRGTLSRLPQHERPKYGMSIA